jgi:hypothetical protein
MWIVTKLSGMINTEHVTRFTQNSFGTYAHCGAASHLLSDRQILTTIILALKNNQDFLEVK